MILSAVAKGQHVHEHMAMPSDPPKKTAPKGPSITLAELERLALERNPRIGSAKSMVDAASGRVKQAGLWPNPVVGATGDHVSAATNGGAIGGFVEQRIVTGGKLHWAKEVAEKEKAEIEESAGAERLRVLTMVRLLYFEVLGGQAMVEAREELAAIGRRTASTAKELANVGQADSPDVLAAANEAERLDIDLESAKRGLEQARSQLAAVVGEASIGNVEGKLEDLRPLGISEKVLTESPEVRVAELEIERARAAVKRAQVENIPDVMLRGGVRNNRELNGLTPIGVDGIFDVSVQLPIFNRNQGAIASAKADAERARYESDRVKIDLRTRMAAAVRRYEESKFAAERYRTKIVPQAEQSLEQYTGNFMNMAVAYPMVLSAQRSLGQYRDAYIRAMVEAQQAAVEVEGMLLVRAMGESRH
jgi:cobalt-zinc-cadmium efflux system outer membrane protein